MAGDNMALMLAAVQQFVRRAVAKNMQNMILLAFNDQQYVITMAIMANERVPWTDVHGENFDRLMNALYIIIKEIKNKFLPDFSEEEIVFFLNKKIREIKMNEGKK